MSFPNNHYIWLIGASEGIGRALAKQLAESGARLALTARNQARLGNLLAELPGHNHVLAPCDITDEAALQQAWDSVRAAGSLDVVIFNAGVYEPMAADTFNLVRAQQMMQVNFSAALPLLSHIVPYFVSRRAGHIALVGSVAGYRGLPAAIGYGASKAALIHLAENLRCDLKKFGIKVQVINPGFVATRLTAKNNFAMPSIITPERAAQHILQGLASARFEIRFPFLFSTAFKVLRLLPYWLYFRLVSSGK